MLTTSKYPSPKGDITLISITNASGAKTILSTLGAGIVEVNVPDKDGKLDDVVLGYANPADYIGDGPCAGKCPGRYANRIGAGKFSISGKEYQLAVNNGPNALHGGPEGFQNQIWDSEAKGSHVKFTYLSSDGEEGYPGNLKAEVIYSWNEHNELTIDITAESDKKTVVNLTNHAYFNLDGENSGSVLEHTLLLNASRFLEADMNLLPTGNILSVEGTPMIFVHRWH